MEASLEQLLDASGNVGFSQLLLIILAAVLAYTANQMLLNLSAILFTQPLLWVRRLRYWVPLVRLSVWGGFVAATIMILSPTRQVLFALLTSMGVAVGLAAQELIKNVFGAIVIWSDKAFSEGDRITIGEVEGIVRSIGLRSTRIWAYDDTIVVVPNSTILTATVYNSNDSAADEQVVIDLYLPADADTDLAMDLARTAAIGSDLLEPSKPLVVQVTDLMTENGTVSRIRIKAYVRGVAYEKMLASNITATAKRLYREAGLYHPTAAKTINEDDN